MYAQLGWRNIWRNPRRTLVILCAVVVGVWSMILLGGTMSGMYESMIENALSRLTGHLQIHHPDYRNDPVVDNRMENPDELARQLDTALPEGSKWAPRVRVAAVAQNARHSSGITMVGIVPERERGVSFIPDSVVDGRYLEEGDGHRILIGKALADKFETGLGKKIILMSQGADDEIRSRAYRIAGIFDAEMQSTEEGFAFVTSSSARDMLRMDDDISEVAVWLPEREMTPEVVEVLRAELGERYEVAGFRELMPLITAQIGVWDTFMILWYLVVFIAMGFGIVNTILMAVMERIREFGLLKALGMRPYSIVVSVLWECLFILGIGVVMGNLLGFVSIWALADTGINLTALAAGAEKFSIPRIIYPIIRAGDVLLANGVVLVLGMLVSLYPAVKAARFTPVEALTHV
ncbi:MAG: ABC transporter permease [Desulfatibacillaceae bacterium]